MKIKQVRTLNVTVNGVEFILNNNGEYSRDWRVTEVKIERNDKLGEFSYPTIKALSLALQRLFEATKEL